MLSGDFCHKAARKTRKEMGGRIYLPRSGLQDLSCNISPWARYQSAHPAALARRRPEWVNLASLVLFRFRLGASPTSHMCGVVHVSSSG